MKIREVLAFNEEKMLKTLMWLAPEFARLQHANLRRAMGGRVSVAQAARIAGLPLTEMLYILNLAVGEQEETLAEELLSLDKNAFDYPQTKPAAKPKELINLSDNSSNVFYDDLMLYADQNRDPMPAIIKGLNSLKNSEDVLLLKHSFDPIPLRDLFARRGFSSWAEERTKGKWFIYFYRPSSAKAQAHNSLKYQTFADDRHFRGLW